jgi:hypothetical protein
MKKKNKTDRIRRHKKGRFNTSVVVLSEKDNIRVFHLYDKIPINLLMGNMLAAFGGDQWKNCIEKYFNGETANKFYASHSGNSQHRVLFLSM